MTPTRYTTTAISLHWLISLIIFAGFGLGLYMNDLPLSPAKLKYYSWHKWMGVTVFLLAVLRLGGGLTHPAPEPPAGMPEWQRKAASATHHLLYVLILVIPISGWVYSSAAGVPVVYLGFIPLPDLVSPDKPLAAQRPLSLPMRARRSSITSSTATKCWPACCRSFARALPDVPSHRHPP